MTLKNKHFFVWATRQKVLEIAMELAGQEGQEAKMVCSVQLITEKNDYKRLVLKIGHVTLTLV